MPVRKSPTNKLWANFETQSILSSASILLYNSAFLLFLIKIRNYMKWSYIMYWYITWVVFLQLESDFQPPYLQAVMDETVLEFCIFLLTMTENRNLVCEISFLYISVFPHFFDHTEFLKAFLILREKAHLLIW